MEILSFKLPLPLGLTFATEIDKYFLIIGGATGMTGTIEQLETDELLT